MLYPVRAREREIRRGIISPMLSGSEMFDVEADNHCIPLWQKAVLTAVPCPVANELTYGLIHQLTIRSVDHTLFKNCASLCLQNCDEINYGNIRIVFLTLCQGQLALIRFVSKFVNTSLCLLINAKIDELLGDFRSQKRPKRIKKTVEYVSSHHAGIISHC